MSPRDRLTRQGPAVLLTVMSVVYVVISYQYDEETRMLPLLVAWTTLVLLIIELLCQGESRLGGVLRLFLSGEVPGAEAQTTSNTLLRREIGAFVWVFSVLGAVVLFGFYITIPLFVSSFLRFYARKSWTLALSVAVILTGAIWILFEVLMGYQLFYGFLFGDY